MDSFSAYVQVWERWEHPPKALTLVNVTCHQGCHVRTLTTPAAMRPAHHPAAWFASAAFTPLPPTGAPSQPPPLPHAGPSMFHHLPLPPLQAAIPCCNPTPRREELSFLDHLPLLPLPPLPAPTPYRHHPQVRRTSTRTASARQWTGSTRLRARPAKGAWSPFSGPSRSSPTQLRRVARQRGAAAGAGAGGPRVEGAGSGRGWLGRRGIRSRGRGEGGAG